MAPANVFLTLDPSTAAALGHRLRQLFESDLGKAGQGWPAIRLLGRDQGLPAAALAHSPPSAILICSTRHVAWMELQEAGPGSVSLTYVRPELVFLRDAVDRLWEPDTAAAIAWARLLALDQRLKSLPRLSMEDVHGGSLGLWPALAAAIGLPRSGIVPTSAPMTAGAGYDAALAALLPPLELAAAPDDAPPLLWPGHYPTVAGGSGLRFLGRGWSHAEPGHIWSDGRAASLTLPPGEPGRSLRCRIHGSLVQALPGRTTAVALSLDRQQVGRIAADPHRVLDIVLEARLPAMAPDGVHVLDFRFDGPLCPRDLGHGADDRRLVLALRAVEIVADAQGDASPVRAWPGREPPAQAAVSILDDPLGAATLSRVRPALTLVLSSDPAVGRAAARGCTDRGCAEVLVLDAAADALGQAARALVADQRRVDLAILCDEAQVGPWFAAVIDAATAPALEGASFLLATSDPYRGSAEFFRYSHEWNGLVQQSDAMLACVTWGAS